MQNVPEPREKRDDGHVSIARRGTADAPEASHGPPGDVNVRPTQDSPPVAAVIPLAGGASAAPRRAAPVRATSHEGKRTEAPTRRNGQGRPPPGKPTSSSHTTAGYQRPVIIVQNRRVERNAAGQKIAAKVFRTTITDLSEQGRSALEASPHGSQVFVNPNTSPAPTMITVVAPGTPEKNLKPEHIAHARVCLVSKATLRGWLSAAARWRCDGMGQLGNEDHEQDPPDSVVSYMLENCDGLRPLHGVVEHPIIRPDGSLSGKGYDPATRFFAWYAPDDVQALSIPENPTREECQGAREFVLNYVRDFPFKTPAHADAWLSYCLTLVGCEMYAGNAPAFIIKANKRGSGKSLLAELGQIIATGSRAAGITYDGDEEEFAKQITTEALLGARVVFIDNVKARFNSPTFDKIATSGRHRGRILGANKNFDGPMRAVWVITANNPDIDPDGSRRVQPCELDSPLEDPESREGFHADGIDGITGADALRARVAHDRWIILGALLTMLRGWAQARARGESVAITTWGSFEAWSRVVRGAIVYAGGVDPGTLRAEFAAVADTGTNTLRALLASWCEATSTKLLPREGASLTMAVNILTAEARAAREEEREPRGVALREALETVGGERLEAWNQKAREAAGKFLRTHRRTVARTDPYGDLRFEASGTHNGSNRWIVQSPQAPSDIETL